MVHAFARASAALLGGLAVLAATTAAAATTPATPVAVQLQLKAILGQIRASGLEFVPTRVPIHYAYEGYSVAASPPRLEVTFVDQRYLKNSTVRAKHAIAFDSAYTNRGAEACSVGSRTTLRVGQNRVYLGPVDGEKAIWLCVPGTRAEIKLSARGALPAKTLAMLVVYARSVK